MSAKKGLTMKNSYRNIFFSKLQYLSGKKKIFKNEGNEYKLFEFIFWAWECFYVCENFCVSLFVEICNI